MELPKPDCVCASREKCQNTSPAGFDGTPSPVQFEGKTCGIAAIFSAVKEPPSTRAGCSQHGLDSCHDSTRSDGFDSVLRTTARLSQCSSAQALLGWHESFRATRCCLPASGRTRPHPPRESAIHCFADFALLTRSRGCWRVGPRVVGGGVRQTRRPQANRDRE